MAKRRAASGWRTLWLGCTGLLAELLYPLALLAGVFLLAAALTLVLSHAH
ncbi:MAG: hypothetical protein LBQ83_03935 [Candidatus Margulisbacteria bacterium]|jgi:hypothetical protein|nr:hypothetical protein [Candidatus Margulisiibacteriota bacterium]